MSDPRDAFAANAPPSLRGAAGEELSRALGALVARGAARWPQLPLEPAALVAQATRQLPQTLTCAALPGELDALHAGDLHLACACAAGSPAAFVAFEQSALGTDALRAALRRIDPSPAFADEVAQALRAKLLIARPGQPARIADYSGRWPLSTWLKTIAVRAAVDLKRGGGAANVSSGDRRSAEQLAGSDNPELGYLKQRYGTAFQEALGQAFAALDDEQSNLLRLQLVDGLSTSQIAALFGVDRSTIKRRLASCRARVLDETRRLLRETLRLSPAEFESLANLVKSQLHVSLARLLRRQ